MILLPKSVQIMLWLTLGFSNRVFYKELRRKEFRAIFKYFQTNAVVFKISFSAHFSILSIWTGTHTNNYNRKTLWFICSFLITIFNIFQNSLDSTFFIEEKYFAKCWEFCNCSEIFLLQSFHMVFTLHDNAQSIFSSDQKIRY